MPSPIAPIGSRPHDVMEYPLAYQGSVFSTRAKGVQVLIDLESKLVVDLGEVVLDFSGVKHISFAFADEFIGRLAQRAADYEGESPRLANLSPEIAVVVSITLRSRELPEHLIDYR